MENTKKTLAKILEREFTNEIFTHFAVMTWAHEGDFTQWKTDFHAMVEAGELVEVEKRLLGTVYTHRDSLAISWNCCANHHEPDWSAYDALELAGCIAEDGYVERVEEGTTPTFYTVYGHLIGGGCEALHDWPQGFNYIEGIRAQCAGLAERLGFTVWDMAA